MTAAPRRLHVVMFGDQHAETSGGAQVAMRLQRRFLERAGHTVTIVAPRRHGRDLPGADDPAYVDVPSIAVPTDREYSFVWPGRRADAAVDLGIARRMREGASMPDLVHVQADYWGAFLGARFADRARLPLVHTMHNRLDVGIEATAPFPGLVLRAVNAWRRLMLPGSGPGSDGWAHLRALASRAHAVTAPSSHFARRLEQHGVADRVDVIWNGIDDDALAAVRADDPPSRRDGSPVLVWVGRMSPEKRLLPFLEAVAQSGVDARVEVVGGGFELDRARQLVAERGLADRVRFVGRLAYRDSLRRIAGADALVQTSIGFETQGMTPFEAACLGTPAIVSDPDIADEMGAGIWRVPPASTEDDRIRALAQTLQAAVADIVAGSAPVPSDDVTRRFRQSASTDAMLEVYRRVL